MTRSAFSCGARKSACKALGKDNGFEMRNFKGKERSRSDIVARADDAFGSSNYAEYMVDVKVKGRYKAARIGMILLYLAVAAAFIVVAAVLTFPWIVAAAPLFVWILWFFTWPYVSRSYY